MTLDFGASCIKTLVISTMRIEHSENQSKKNLHPFTTQ